MKVSLNWLAEWVKLPTKTQVIVEQLTMVGIEVEAVEEIQPQFSSVVVGEVIQVQPHPNADRLKVCEVNAAQAAMLQIVCGAQNVRAGLKVPVALIGAQLPNGIQIKKTKLRGVESGGMLCSATELSLKAVQDGLMELPHDAPVGTALEDYLPLKDVLLTVAITPNRGDCLSVLGLARELAAINNVALDETPLPKVTATIRDSLPIRLLDNGCPRYLGRVIKNINAGIQSPTWLQKRLEDAGIRSIHPVVDITNYVLLELGQPMHAFDYQQLVGEIQVRKALPNESLTLLDETSVTLATDTLVIADQEQVLAIAGVMGGLKTGVTATTTAIFLECAFFAPLTLAGKARHYNALTESAYRFERGVDYRLQEQALERATELILEIVGGEAGPILKEEITAAIPIPAIIPLRLERIRQLLGITLSCHEVEDILKRLDMAYQSLTQGEWQVSVPSYRFDLSLEEDLIEEVARLYGYQQLPTALPSIALSERPAVEPQQSLALLRHLLIGRGYHEAITYSFTHADLQQTFASSHSAIKLLNPITSDLEVMRTSLLPGLLKSLSYNLKHQQARVRLFEIGPRFYKNNGAITEEMLLAGVICGRRYPENWSHTAEEVDFYDIKGDIETLLLLSGLPLEQLAFSAADHNALQTGQAAHIEYDGRRLGTVGALNPVLKASFDLSNKVFVFELLLKEILKTKVPLFQEIAYYPEVHRDIAIIIHESVVAERIETAIRHTAGPWLKRIVLFDVYRGQHIEPGKKSFALGLTLQHPSRTLRDEEVNSLIEQVIAVLNNQFNAVLRN